MYCALIGDIVNSKKIKNRLEVQKNLTDVLHKINCDFSSYIEARFTITIGDEFQGLLKSPEKVIKIIDLIKMESHPTKFRFGIGIGKITTMINKDMAIGADGPAYYSAREALQKIKESNYKYEQPSIDTLIRCNNCNKSIKERLELINATLSTCHFIENKWSEKQREIVKALIEKEMSQRELAQYFNIKQSSIQRRIDYSGFYTYNYAKNSINHFLNSIWEELYHE